MSSQEILIRLIRQLYANKDCAYSMKDILAVCRELYQKDLSVHGGSLLLFLMQQFVDEDIEKYIEFIATFATVDDQVMLKFLSGKISKDEIANMREKGHLKHYLNYVNETVSHMFYDTDLYQAVYLPAYLIKDEIKFAHVRGEENAGLVVTFVSLQHANGFTKNYEDAVEYAKDFYEYNKAGNTPIYGSVEVFFVKPLLIRKQEFEALEIYKEDQGNKIKGSSKDSGK
ncbi:MAG: hypothetical protein E7191_01865 [Erysipelotrichaceae bacterium]|nr:hypothetical protein [Erysipelotrichaceae bacterium]